MAEKEGLGMSLGKSVGGAIAGTALGMATAKWQDRRQLKQQGKLNAQQMQSDKQMADYNQALGLKMWKDTNYKAQVEELKKAGLNVGLMYEGGGQGGTTTTAGGKVSAPSAPSGGDEIMSGMGMVNNIQMVQAQTNLAQANTKLTEEKTKTEPIARGAIAATTEKTKADTIVSQYEGTIKEIEAAWKSETYETMVEKLDNENRKIKAEADQAETNAEISEETKKEVIKQAQIRTIEAQLTNAMLKVNKEKGEAEIAQIRQLTKNAATQIILERQKGTQKWWELKYENYKISQQQIQLELNKLQTKFNTGQGAEELRESQKNKNIKDIINPRK